MSAAFQIFLQTISAGLSAIAMYFIWELIREYKAWKKETQNILDQLKGERQNYELVIGAARLKMDQTLMAAEHGFKTINLEFEKVKMSMAEVQSGASRSKEFMKMTLKLVDAINKRINGHESEIKTIKVQMGDTTIFKTKK